MMSSYPNQPKRPRLSLQIKPVVGINSRASKTLAIIDPKSPTAFNTLSNAYAAVVDRSTPIQAEPITAINTLQSTQLQTAIEHPKDQKLRVQTPFSTAYPETPLTAHPITPNGPMDFAFPSVMTATPPLSAGPTDNSDPKVFTFTSTDVSARPTGILSPTEPRTPRRRTTLNTTTPSKPPYTHPRTLHSILRNSPLPPLTTRTPMSPRRQSLRLQEKAAKRVGYNNPLTQTITTNKYTKSHIDLLVEEASPYSPMSAEDDPEIALDLALAYAGNETRDGGMTPGPFEEMRRRMAGLGTETPSSPSGIRKRKKKEKKRRWVWTIGQEEEEEEVGGAMAALRAAEAAGTLTIHPAPTSFADMPAPILDVPEQIGREQSADLSECESWDVPMSDSSSFVSEDQAVTPMYQDEDEDVDMRTPTVEKIGKADQAPVFPARLGSVGLMGEGRGRRDTPIPPDLLPSAQ